MIRAAIVGIGRWGRTLVGAAQGKSEAFRFIAGQTRTRAKAEAFCAEHGIALRDSLDEILADPAIDAVVFATPHSEHGAQVERAAAAGKHVFMEKPFTLDRRSAARALDRVARAGVVLGLDYPRRFPHAGRELEAAIGDNAEDTASVMCGFAGGMSGTLLCSLVTAVGYRLAAFGSKGCGEVATTDLEFRFTAAPDSEPAGRRTQPAPEIIQYPGFNA